MAPEKEVRPLTRDQVADNEFFLTHSSAMPAGKPPFDYEAAARKSSGDYKAANLFAAFHWGQYIHVSEAGWHFFDGKRWKLDVDAAKVRHALFSCVGEYREFISDYRVNHQGVAHAARYDGLPTQTAAKCKAVLDTLTSLPGFSASLADFDKGQDVINLENGTYNLTTHQLEDHCASDLLLKLAGTSYFPQLPVDPHQEKVWRDFLTSTLVNEEVRDFVQELAGLALLGYQREHIVVFLTGTGANGKGTFYKALLNALGDYGAAVPNTLLEASRNSRSADAPSPAVLDLMGKRLGVASELKKMATFDAAKLKFLVGNDEIVARGLYSKNLVRFMPQYSLWFVTNHLPDLPADDPATWRRVVVVDFDQVFTADTMDRHLDDKLRDAADAIFAWAIEGLKRYQDRGHLDPPEAVQVAADEYRDRVDTVRQFLEEMCVSVADRKIATTVTDVFKAYDRWARDDVNLRDYKVGRRQDFTDALLRHGWEALRTKRGYLCVAQTSGEALAVRSAPFVDKTLVANQLVDLSNHVYSAAVRDLTPPAEQAAPAVKDSTAVIWTAPCDVEFLDAEVRLVARQVEALDVVQLEVVGKVTHADQSLIEVGLTPDKEGVLFAVELMSERDGQRYSSPAISATRRDRIVAGQREAVRSDLFPLMGAFGADDLPVEWFIRVSNDASYLARRLLGNGAVLGFSEKGVGEVVQVPVPTPPVAPDPVPGGGGIRYRPVS